MTVVEEVLLIDKGEMRAVKAMRKVVDSVAKGSEISAAKHRRGRKKLCGAGKIWGQTFGLFIKKRPKRG
jgi:acetyl-CoA carboxylase carboxyltransferase component